MPSCPGKALVLAVALLLAGTELARAQSRFSSDPPPSDPGEDPALELVPGVGTRQTGHWRLADGEYGYEGRCRHTLPLLRRGFRNGRISLRANGHTAGLVLRSQDPKGLGGVWFVVRPSFRQAYWFVRRKGTWFGKRGLTRLKKRPGDHLLLELKVTDDLYEAWVDGQAITPLRETRFEEGGILLHAWWSGHFQDLNLDLAHVGRRGPPKSHLFVRLFAGRNFTGPHLDCAFSAADLSLAGFHDSASSAQVWRGPAFEEGDEVTLCAAPAFARILGSMGPGFYPNLPRGMANRIGSLRMPGPVPSIVERLGSHQD